MRDEQTLIDALKAGEPHALECLYREHARTVLAWAIRLGGPRLDAEDIAQEVFIIALRKVSSFRGDSQIRTWLFSITRNVVNNRRRRAAIRRFVGLDRVQEIPDQHAQPDVQMERMRQRTLVQRTLNRMSASQREVIVLMDLEERSAPEVAKMLGVPPGTVYSRLHYARRAFTKALKHESNGEMQHLFAREAGETT